MSVQNQLLFLSKTTIGIDCTDEATQPFIVQLRNVLWMNSY